MLSTEALVRSFMKLSMASAMSCQRQHAERHKQAECPCRQRLDSSITQICSLLSQHQQDGTGLHGWFCKEARSGVQTPQKAANASRIPERSFKKVDGSRDGGGGP